MRNNKKKKRKKEKKNIASFYAWLYERFFPLVFKLLSFYWWFAGEQISLVITNLPFALLFFIILSPFHVILFFAPTIFFYLYNLFTYLKVVLTTHMKLSWFDYLSRMENKKRLSHDRVFFFFFPSTIFTWANRISLRVSEDEFWCTVNGESEGERNLCNMKLG